MLAQLIKDKHRAGLQPQQVPVQLCLLTSLDSAPAQSPQHCTEGGGGWTLGQTTDKLGHQQQGRKLPGSHQHSLSKPELLQTAGSWELNYVKLRIAAKFSPQFVCGPSFFEIILFQKTQMKARSLQLDHILSFWLSGAHFFRILNIEKTLQFYNLISMLKNSDIGIVTVWLK